MSGLYPTTTGIYGQINDKLRTASDPMRDVPLPVRILPRKRL
ncbi:MAG: hypothetical protein R2748_12970 [Bryobacterales bacterium]